MTSYIEIFNRFAFKIKDYVILEMDDNDVYQACLVWMNAAIPKIRKMTSDLSNRNDIVMQFADDLTEIEKEVITNMMIVEWLEPQINSQNLINQMYGGKEEKFFSQASHLSELRLLKKAKWEETQKLIRSSKYSSFADSINEENENA